jgi:hypothetical protein
MESYMQFQGAAAAAAFAMLSLAACSKGGGGAAHSAGQAAAPAAAEVAISEADLPHVKAGYWEVTDTGLRGISATRHSCASGKPMRVNAAGLSHCSQFSFKRNLLGQVVIDATCGEHGFSGASHGVISGDFDSNYVTEMTTTLTIPGRSPMSFHWKSQAHWLGPCPAGSTPED